MVTILITSNKEMNIIMKTAPALEDSNMLLNGVTKQLKVKYMNENEKEGF